MALPLLVVLAVLLSVALIASGSGVDRAQERICKRTIEALEESGASIESVAATPHPHADHAIMLSYQVQKADGEAENHWIACHFEGGTFTPGRLSLVGVTTDREGSLTSVGVAMLRIWLRLSGTKVLDPVGGDARAHAPPSSFRAYGQQSRKRRH